MSNGLEQPDPLDRRLSIRELYAELNRFEDEIESRGQAERLAPTVLAADQFVGWLDGDFRVPRSRPPSLRQGTDLGGDAGERAASRPTSKAAARKIARRTDADRTAVREQARRKREAKVSRIRRLYRFEYMGLDEEDVLDDEADDSPRDFTVETDELGIVTRIFGERYLSAISVGARLDRAISSFSFVYSGYEVAEISGDADKEADRR
ncbi:unnamed protein product [marine sediment metagenome]|uniref:Uncharacterized protein n=1 Tax=marine sediment metagenome TaxID=412755 RepID=X0TUB0_9ZZZZ